jgi:hypothetical protein
MMESERFDVDGVSTPEDRSAVSLHRARQGTNAHSPGQEDDADQGSTDALQLLFGSLGYAPRGSPAAHDEQHTVGEAR